MSYKFQIQSDFETEYSKAAKASFISSD